MEKMKRIVLIGNELQFSEKNLSWKNIFINKIINKIVEIPETQVFYYCLDHNAQTQTQVPCPLNKLDETFPLNKLDETFPLNKLDENDLLLEIFDIMILFDTNFYIKEYINFMENENYITKVVPVPYFTLNSSKAFEAFKHKLVISNDLKLNKSFFDNTLNPSFIPIMYDTINLVIDNIKGKESSFDENLNNYIKGVHISRQNQTQSQTQTQDYDQDEDCGNQRKKIKIV